MRKIAPPARLLTVGAAACLMAASVMSAHAQFTFASDEASNYGGGGEPGWTNGANAGSGFNAWSFTIGGSAGGFIGNPSSGGIGGMDAESFGLYANPTNAGNFIDVNRNLSSAMQVGDSFSFQWGVNWDSAGPGNKGFNIYVGTNQVINVNTGGNADIFINGTNTTFGFGTNVMTWNFHYLNATTLAVTANDRDGAGSYSNNFTVSGGVDAFRWYASQLASGDQRQPYYDNLAVTNSGIFSMGGSVTNSRAFTGSGALSIGANTTLTLSNAGNTFSGGLTISNGSTLRAVSAGSGTINLSGTLASDGATARTFTNTVTLGGNVILGEASTGTGDLTLSGGFGLGSTARIVTVNNAQSTISGAVSGSGNFTKSGTGSLTLSGNNTFSGVLTVTEGKLTINTINNASVDGVLGNSANAVVLGSSGQTGFLHYTGGNASSTKTFTAASSGTAGLEVSNAATTLTLSGAIGGSGSVQKGGAGILLLSGTNTFTGALNIHDGTIQVASINNASANGTLGNSTHAIGLGKTNTSNTGTLLYSGATNASTTKGFALESDSSGAGVINVSNAVALTVSGAITGGGRFQKAGAGTLVLATNNSYTGATTVSAGRLVVNGTNTSSAVTVNSGASLGGSGKVGALTVSGLVAPGNSIGTLSAGSTVFNGLGSFELEVFNWTSTAGTGWDLLAITGDLTLSNTAGSPFTINLVSLQDSSTAGLSTNWNQNVNFTNTFVTYTGSLLGTAFNTNLFTVNTNGFQNPFNGAFSITNVSGGLALLYTTSFVPSSTYTWNTNSGLWGTAGNWTNGTAPTNGASIIFAGAAGGASTNSSTVSSISSLTFSNTAGSYTISGSAMAVGAGGISNASTAAQTISNNLSLSANADITAAGGNLTLAGNLTNGGNAVTVGGAANTAINGVISGAGALTKSGSGSLTLSGSNTYTGATTISAGTVVADNNTALGATNGSTTVGSGATLELSGGMTTAENITISGSGVGGVGAIRSLGDGENTLTGTIALGGNARINADGPSATPVTVASFSSSGFTVVDEFTDISYSQSSTGLTLTSAGLGALLTGDFTSSLNLSGYNVFGVRASVSGANPDLSFNLKLLGSDFVPVRTYQGSTTAFATNSTLVYLTPVSGSGSLASVPGIDWVWGGSGTVSFTLIDLVATSSSGLTISGNIAAGANVLSLGAAGPSGGIAGGNITANGVVSGAGNTNSGTITSLLKDGSGTLTLGGANSYTGDTRIEGGAVVVNAGGSLGSGSDVFLSAGTYLGLRTTTTVSSFQGASNTASIFLDGSGTRLVMNGADRGTVQQNAVISGSGGLTLSASGDTVLRLNSDNTFRGTTVITGGTLELATTGVDQGALRLTASVSIGSGATLLISDSDQIKDAAAISLSGGTIQRGSGVSEIFGNLNITGGSTLDFGTGEIGTLQFQTYSYTGSALIEVQSFLAGNRLQFLSSSFTSGSLTQFDFNGIGYNTTFEGNYFTITAIPEPSTYLAAAGLLALMLWSNRGALRSWRSRKS